MTQKEKCQVDQESQNIENQNSEVEKKTIRTKDRYCKHLTQEENQMLDIIADIIAGYVLENGGKK